MSVGDIAAYLSIDEKLVSSVCATEVIWEGGAIFVTPGAGGSDHLIDRDTIIRTLTDKITRLESENQN